MSIIECDDTTQAKHPIDIEEANQDVIKGVPSINECEVNFCSFGYGLRGCNLRFLFAKGQQRSKAGFTKITKSYSLPTVRLRGINHNVTFATDFRHCLADE